jgi:hypothetical protein
MKMVFFILLFQLIYLIKGIYLNLRGLEKKKLEKPNIELIIVGVLGFLFFIVVVIIIIKYINNHNTQDNVNQIKKKENKKINLLKKNIYFKMI